jgi:hypothetical protein
MFISLATWRDLTDGHLYHEGEQFPFDGRAVPEDRIEALESGRNRAGLRLIRADKASDEQPEGKKQETPKKATGGRKTASAGKAKK